MDYLRPYTVQVTARTFWLLQRVAAARRNGDSALDPKTNQDSVAEEILSSHLAEMFPALPALFDQREKVNAEAEQLILAKAKEI